VLFFKGYKYIGKNLECQGYETSKNKNGKMASIELNAHFELIFILIALISMIMLNFKHIVNNYNRYKSKQYCKDNLKL